MDYSNEGRNDIIICIFLIAGFGIYIRLSDNTIACDLVPYQRFMALMVDLHNYDLETINRKIQPYS